MERQQRTNRLHLFLLVSLMIVFIWSAIGPREWGTWVMEVTPAVVGAVILTATYRRFPLTSLTYILIWFFSIILIVGGHYTYAEMPLFNWLRDHYELSRNHYDRFGHFFQGVTPAILTREVLLRTSPLKKGKWLFFIVLYVFLFWTLIDQFTDEPDIGGIISIVFSICLMVLFNIIIVIMQLETEIDESKISVKYKPFHIKPRVFYWEDISDIYCRYYRPIKEYGGFGIRKSIKKGTAYNLKGRNGLQIIFKDYIEMPK